MKYLTLIFIVTTAVILHSAGATSLYRLEAKRKLLKSSSKEYQAEADSLRTLLLQYELAENDHFVDMELELDPTRRHSLSAKNSRKSGNSAKSPLISSLDSLELLIKKYAEEDKEISDTIKAYLKGVK
jgi:hypothetical protein